MDKEQKAMFSDMGKQAEKIVFLFFSAMIFGKDETVSMLFNMFDGK